MARNTNDSNSTYNDPQASDWHVEAPTGNKRGIPARLVCDALACDDICKLLASHKSLSFNMLQNIAIRANRQDRTLDRRYDAYFRRCHAFSPVSRVRPPGQHFVSPM